MEVSEKEMFKAMLDKAEKTAEEKAKEQDDSWPDYLCEDCDKYGISKELGLIKGVMK